MDHARSNSPSAPSNAQSKFEHDPTATHERIQMRAGTVSVRDAVPSDVEDYINYWHYSGEKIKELLGVDRKKLGAPEDSRRRFLGMIRTPGVEQTNVVFTITLNNDVIGYSNLNHYGLDDNYVHLHTYHSLLRSALRRGGSIDSVKTSAGLAAVLIGRIGMYFDLFPIRRIILPSRTTNRWINHALDLYMPPSETLYLNAPAGLAAPNEYHLRYIDRDRARWMRNRSERINKGLISDAPIRANRIGLSGRVLPHEHTSPSAFA